MLTAYQLDVLIDPILDLYARYEQSVIEDIARRLAKSAFSSAAWQVQRLNESGLIYKRVLERLAQLTGQSQSTLRAIFKRAGVKTMTFDDSVYAAAGLRPMPMNLSPAMARVLAEGVRKTAGLFNNLTLSTAIAAQEAYFRAADLAYMQVSSGSMSYDQAIKQAILSVASDGLTTIRYPSGHRDHLDVAIRRTVLTGVSQTALQMQMTRADEMAQDLVQVSAHIGARNKGEGPENHESWQGKIYSRSGNNSRYPNFVEVTGYGTGEGLGGWNCVVGETVVSGPAIRAAYHREYSGEIIIIRTARGHELTITPNHPVLTNKGWIAASLLAEGDNVFSRSGFDGVDGISPDPNHDEPRIEDVFNSLSQSGDVFGLPASAGYFHGDVSDSKINVVFPQGFLRDRLSAKLSQDKEQISFGDAIKFPGSLITDGALNEIAFRSLHSPDGVMSGFGEFGASIGSNSFKAGAHGIGPTLSKRNPQPGEILPDHPLRDTNFGGDFVFPKARVIQGEKFIGGYSSTPFEIGNPIPTAVDAIPLKAILNSVDRTVVLDGYIFQADTGIIEIDNIIHIERKSTQGSFIHVYNLETEGGWYFANGIITHNCRHSFYPYFEGLSESAYTAEDLKNFAAETVKYNGKEMSVYDATQTQRAIERKIRYWKRQAGALDAGGFGSEAEAAKVKQWQAVMRDFTRQTGLSRQYVRERVLY